MKAKTFDCVEMKHRGAEKVQVQTQGMTLEQELTFWRERSRILWQRQENAKRGRRVLTNEEQPTP